MESPTKNTTVTDDIFYPLPSCSEHILWTPPYKQPLPTRFSTPERPDSTASLPFAYSFSDETMTQIQAVANYAFNGPSIDTMCSITLYSPHEAGHVVIDSVVKLVADRHQADVLVLDALELALGEFGALGTGSYLCTAEFLGLFFK